MLYLYNYTSPLGPLYLISDGENLTGLHMEQRRYCSLDFSKIPESNSLPVFHQAKKWLDIYFQGKEPDFIPPMRTAGTPFQESVWKHLLEIPYGKVVTYNDIAKKIAEDRGIARMSAQAVGGAVGRNPISILIPCHRVVGTDGSLTGYGGGLENKTRLLALEHLDMSKFHMPKSSK